MEEVGVSLERKLPVLERPTKSSTREILQNPNIFSWKEVLPRLKKESEMGKTIVTTNGHFVLFHSGHSVSLEQAREVGVASRLDNNNEAVVLLAIVNADHQTVKKDPVKASAQSAFERAANVYDNRHSDHVVISEAAEGDSTLTTDFQRLADANLIGPNFIYVKGGDYSANTPPEAEIVVANGGIFKVVDRVGAYSTSSQVEKMLAEAKRQGRL